MAIAQRTTGQEVRAHVRTVAVRAPGALVAKTVSILGKLVAGSGGGYRSYPKEGFPEHELQQIVAGRKNRFDGLM